MPKRIWIVALLFATPVFAKTHKYKVESPCSRVWAATKDVLMHSGKYGVMFMSDKDMDASYNIGGNLGGKRMNSVQLSPRGKNCRISIQTAYSGLIHNDAGAFYKRLKRALDELPQQQAAAPAPAASPNSSGSTAAAPPKPAAAATTMLKIQSDPTGADIRLDGNFVGDTPSSIGVKPGEHVIEVSKTGYQPWERQIKTTRGTVSISADLAAAGNSK